MAFVDGKPADPGPEQAPFFIHFGHFMWQYSNLERLCHWVFHGLSGLEEEVARALIGGEQLSKITKLLNSVVRAKGDKARIDEMQDLIAQIDVISKLRHDLIHRGAETRVDGTFNVSNESIAKSRESTEILRLNIDHLKNAAADLECISFRLALFHFPEAAKKISQAWQDILAAPWRYKRVEPDRPYQQPRNTPR